MQEFQSVIVVRVIRVVSNPVIFWLVESVMLVPNFNVRHYVVGLIFCRLWKWLDESACWLPVISTNHVLDFLLLLFTEGLCLFVPI
jgi:hypothetical protein